MNINKVIAEEINVKVSQVDAAVKLLDEGSIEFFWNFVVFTPDDFRK